MIRALLWKEYREHRAIWVTLAIGGGVCLYGLSQLLGPVWGLSYHNAHESLQTVAVLLAWTYGLVCGAMLLAGEQEAGTLTFLDMLPVRRADIWLAKCLFGLLLLLAQVAVLMGFVVGLGITETPQQLLAILLAMLFLGLFAMSWSLLFSARGENVLNVIGLSFFGQLAGLLLAVIGFLPVAILLALIGNEGGPGTRLVFGCLAGLGLTAVPIAGSARLFAQLDRQRGRFGFAPRRRPGEMSAWASWGRLLWLSYTQMRRLLIGLMIFALMMSFLLLKAGPVAWPGLTLLIGVLCGVTVWSDEQASASFRFLGDQRFPLGRVWLVKIGMRFTLAVAAAVVLLLPSLIVAFVQRMDAQSPDQREAFFFADVLHSDLIGSIVPVESYLSLWLLYGFTAGQLWGMLFRKSLVAGVVALGTAGLLVCLWVPSLFGIGLHFWQVAGVPLMLLLAGWLLMPAWAADRLRARATVVRLGLPLLAAGLWTAAGLWYRIAEIPNVPEPFDLAAFLAGIPPLDNKKNPAGMTISGAWRQVEHMSQELYRKRDGEPLFPELRQRDNQDNFLLEIDAALHEGWPKRPSESELGEWLDVKFEKDSQWYDELKKVVDLPLGAVESLKQMTFTDRLQHDWGKVASLNKVLAVRGLQQQACGDPRPFADNLRISLAVSRNLQHCAPLLVILPARQAEPIILGALDRWLEKLAEHPELLERVRDILLEHETQLPDETETEKTGYLSARNTLEQVMDKLIAERLAYTTRPKPSDRSERRENEAYATALFWRIPWERERHERILRLGFHDLPPSGQRTSWEHQRSYKWGGHVLNDLVPARRYPRGKRALALLHAAQLKVALRLYQARNHNKLPHTLGDLVPRYLPAIPLDPFDGKPFRYRISRGNDLVWLDEAHPAGGAPPAGQGAAPGGFPGNPAAPNGPPAKNVLAGQAILWSIGEDGSDDGGVRQGLHGSPLVHLGEDLIYLVPPPP